MDQTIVSGNWLSEDQKQKYAIIVIKIPNIESKFIIPKTNEWMNEFFILDITVVSLGTNK